MPNQIPNPNDQLRLFGILIIACLPVGRELNWKLGFGHWDLTNNGSPSQHLSAPFFPRPCGVNND
jgi:hypothetical protein